MSNKEWDKISYRQSEGLIGKEESLKDLTTEDIEVLSDKSVVKEENRCRCGKEKKNCTTGSLYG